MRFLCICRFEKLKEVTQKNTQTNKQTPTQYRNMRNARVPSSAHHVQLGPCAIHHTLYGLWVRLYRQTTWWVYEPPARPSTTYNTMYRHLRTVNRKYLSKRISSPSLFITSKTLLYSTFFPSFSIFVSLIRVICIQSFLPFAVSDSNATLIYNHSLRTHLHLHAYVPMNY